MTTESYEALRRLFWLAEARDYLSGEGILDPSDDLLEWVAQDLWEQSVAELEKEKTK